MKLKQGIIYTCNCQVFSSGKGVISVDPKITLDIPRYAPLFPKEGMQNELKTYIEFKGFYHFFVLEHLGQKECWKALHDLVQPAVPVLLTNEPLFKKGVNWTYRLIIAQWFEKQGFIVKEYYP